LEREEKGGFRSLNRKLHVFVLVAGLFLASWFFGGETKSASVEQDDYSAMLNRNGLDVYFFYGAGCPHCARVEPFLAKMEHEYSLRLHRFDVYSNRSRLTLFDEYCNAYGLPLERRAVPTVFISTTYLVGDSPILNGFEDALAKALEAGSLDDAPSEAERQGDTDQEIISTAGSLSILTITVAALVDAVSPCSIAILVFLIGARVLVGNRRKRALKIGLSFCLSVFIAYFLFGLGLLAVVQVSGFSNIFSLLVGLIAVLAGAFYLRDFFWYGRGGFAMEVPRSLKPLLMKMLKGVTSPLGAFAMGFVAVCFELPCTGGPYLFILGQLANNATRFQAVPLLLYHNFIFVLPLIAISLLLYSNLFSIGRIRKWSEEKKRLTRLVGGLIMMALGFLAIPLPLMLHSLQLFLRCFRVIGPFILATMFFYLVVSSTEAKSLRSRVPRLLKGTVMLLSLLVATVFVVQRPVVLAPIDSDGDGIPDDIDNCPYTFNPGQEDFDGNGIGDACENEPPIANAGPDQTVLLGESVIFDGSGSYDPDGIMILYEWDFGDPFDPTFGTGVHPTHTYRQPDVYVVTLTVTDEAGDERSDTMTVVVENTIIMLELNYNSGSFSLLNVYKKHGFAPDRRVQPESGHKVQVISETQRILYAFTFAVPNILMWDYPDGDILTGGSIELDETNFTLIIPYVENAVQIDLYYPDDTLALSVNVENLPEKGGSNCQTMVNNGSSGNLFDIVFVADGYTTAQLPQFGTEVGRHNTTLLSVPPFSNHSSNINIHWVNESRNLGCRYGCRGIPRLICCNDTAVLNLASQCPADEIVVILANNTFGGMGQLSAGDVTSYAVTYNGTDFTIPNPANWSGDRVTVHELGHSFGNLHDEYNYTGAPPMLVGPNCDANPTCPKWSAWNPGACYPGCSSTGWFRGDNTGGDLMLNLTNLNFGPVCTRALNTSLNNYPRTLCGGSTPCQCGDLLTQSRTLNSSDFSAGPCVGDALEIGASGITLDCNGRPIIGSLGPGSTGIKNIWFHNVTIKNCNLSDFDSGIHIKRASNNVLRNNTIYSTKSIPSNGIWIETSTRNNITFNNVTGYKWGIGFDLNSDNNLAEGNTLLSCQRGMELYDSSRNTIKNNIVNNHTVYGIYIGNRSSTNTLIRNTVDFNGRHGLYIRDAAAVGNTVNNNRLCFNNQMSGLYFDIIDADTNLGDNNQCNLAGNWNDTSAAIGCRYGCILGTSIFINATLGVNVTLASAGAITAFIRNVTSATIVANLTSAVAPGFATATLFANLTTKCPPVDWAYIQLYYDESKIIVDESTLMMYYWNPTTSNWTLIPNSGVNTAANYVWANTTHLTIFTGIGELRGPELYIRRRGAEVWPEWHVGLVCWDQTLYARIVNYGEMGAYVEVRFVEVSPGHPKRVYVSNQAWIDGATWIEGDIVPGVVVVSATFHADTPGVFYASAQLYFKIEGMPEKVLYSELEPIFGGEGVSRDLATKYKVKTKMD